MDSALLEYHGRLIRDEIRVNAFVAALKATIRPGMRILDVGTGTGILAVAAAGFGAETYAVDQAAHMIAYARRIAEANGVNVRFLHGAMEDIPGDAIPPVDLVVSETIGHFLLEERIIPTFTSARRFLKPGGILMPRRISLHAVLAHAPQVDEALVFWNVPRGGISFSPIADCSANVIHYEHSPDKTRVFSGRCEFPVIDLSTAEPGLHRFNGELMASADAEINAIALGWKAWLTEEIVLDCSPGVPWPNPNWFRGLMPIGPRQVTAGERIPLRITCNDLEPEFIWTWKLGADQRSTFFGTPIL